MTRKRKNKKAARHTSPPVAVDAEERRPSRSLRYGTAFLLGAAVATTAACLFGLLDSSEPSLFSASSVVDRDDPDLLRDLLAKTPEELAEVDIARMNLLCTRGLPGAENLDVNECVRTLDAWAERVRSETERHRYKFEANPLEYGNSEAEFRMLMLVTVLQQDYGVKYNKERINDIDFKKSKDLFIHGMIGDDNGGTCVSMPVLYTAVARRLGYPVKLALAKEHVFCRWDGSDERFNIEGSSRGFHRRDDEHFKKWPHPIRDIEIEAGHYLKSLSPAEEFAVFLSTRGHCLEDNARLAEANVAYANAHRLSPESPSYRGFLVQSVRKCFGLTRTTRERQERQERIMQEVAESNRRARAEQARQNAIFRPPHQPADGFGSPSLSGFASPSPGDFGSPSPHGIHPGAPTGVEYSP